MTTQEKNGSSVIPDQPAEISGVWVELYPLPEGGFAVDKNGARLLMQRKLRIKARQVRAVTSSYSVEGWAYSGANGTLFGISSLSNRMLDHVDRRADSRIENGRKGGRPPKPAWDVTPSSSIKGKAIEARVAAEHERL